jgi:hypothetical protein
LLEHVFAADKLNAIFNGNRHAQRNRKWLFSSVVGLMLWVVCKIRPSICTAYRSHAELTAGFSCSRDEIIAGYRNRIVDGSKIAATDRRHKILPFRQHRLFTCPQVVDLRL